MPHRQPLSFGNGAHNRLEWTVRGSTTTNKIQDNCNKPERRGWTDVRISQSGDAGKGQQRQSRQKGFSTSRAPAERSFGSSEQDKHVVGWICALPNRDVRVTIACHRSRTTINNYHAGAGGATQCCHRVSARWRDLSSSRDGFEIFF